MSSTWFPPRIRTLARTVTLTSSPHGAAPLVCCSAPSTHIVACPHSRPPRNLLARLDVPALLLTPCCRRLSPPPPSALTHRSDSASQVPDDRQGSLLSGVVYSVLPASAAAVQAAGALIVSAHPGLSSLAAACDGCEATTTAGGSFSFTSLLSPGMYTLRVRAADASALQVTDNSFHVAYDETAAQLGVVASTGSRPLPPLVVLRWDSRRADIDLLVSFPDSDNGAYLSQGAARCDVFKARADCGAAHWAEAVDQLTQQPRPSESVALGDFVRASSYHVFARWATLPSNRRVSGPQSLTGGTLGGARWHQLGTGRQPRAWQCCVRALSAHDA